MVDGLSQQPVRAALRVVGVAVALLNFLLLFVFLFFNPYGTGGATRLTYLIVVLLMGVALGAAWASWRALPRLLFLAFVAGFLPYGCWFLGTPGLFRLVGIATLGYLLVCIGLALSGRAR